MEQFNAKKAREITDANEEVKIVEEINSILFKIEKAAKEGNDAMKQQLEVREKVLKRIEELGFKTKVYIDPDNKKLYTSISW